MLDSLAQRPGLIRALTRAVLAYHAETQHHLGRVRGLSQLLAADADVEAGSMPVLRCAAMLHDFGKLSIDTEILTRAGPLTDDEWTAMKQHSEIGAEILLRLSPDFAPAAAAIRSHHERWDGRGYPDGLAEHAIPKCARIIAVADTLDAITHRRSYRPTIANMHDAIGIIRDETGAQFDPDLTRLLVRRHEQSPGTITAALALGTSSN
jgi:HD-GYP domain-containing protein (c-di-GMP phosphodiesterase class II)